MKKLLLHVCCAPCFVGAIDRLLGKYELSFCFYNPNLGVKQEYDLRKDEFYSLVQNQKQYLNIEVIDTSYDNEFWNEKVLGLEQEVERGRRCDVCFQMRLSKIATLAKLGGFDLFATTLTLSPLKKAEKINEIGKLLGIQQDIKYLPTDFKKQDGFKLSIQLSNQYKLYRQNYCGCIYSKR